MQIKIDIGKQEITQQVYLPIIGGAEGIEALQRRAESLTALACPFCGGAAAIVIKRGLNTLTTQTRCTSCRAQTRQYTSGKQSITTNNELTIDECVIKSFNDWQRRTEKTYITPHNTRNEL